MSIREKYGRMKKRMIYFIEIEKSQKGNKIHKKYN